MKKLKDLTDNIRSNVNGNFLELSDGFVHYELLGNNNQKTVVLIHGFSTPYFIWDFTVAALVEAGFQVLRYDLYGRGYSDRPNIIYNVNLFERQLVNLLLALDINQPVNLIGLSMGGDIAAFFSNHHPHKVNKLCLIDPACFFENKSLYSKVLFSPILGEILMFFWGEKIISSTLDDDFYQLNKFSEYKDKFSIQLKYKGFKQALLSTYRQMSLNQFSEIYSSLAKKNHQILLIWGCKDNTIPFEMSQKIIKIIPNINFHAIEETRHIPHYEKPEVVNPLLISFLQEE